MKKQPIMVEISCFTCRSCTANADGTFTCQQRTPRVNSFTCYEDQPCVQWAPSVYDLKIWINKDEKNEVTKVTPNT